MALSKEIAARDAKLGQPKDAVIAAFEELTQRAKSLMDETNKIFSSYEVNKYVPINLQIQSFQLGEEGKTIGVISGNYDIVSTEIREEIHKFNLSATGVFNKIYEGQFLLGTARTQLEVIECFKQEESTIGGKEQEMSYLEQQEKQYKQKARDGLNSIIQNIERFQEDCHRMNDAPRVSK